MRTDFKAMGEYWKGMFLKDREVNWTEPKPEEMSALFCFLSPDGTNHHADGSHNECGCATQVSNGSGDAVIPEITKAVRALRYEYIRPGELNDAVIDQIVIIQEMTHKMFIDKGLRS